MSLLRNGAVLLTLALGGCINLGGGKPPAVLYTLSSTATRPALASQTASRNAMLLVTEPAAPRELAVNRVPVTEAGNAIAYLKAATWVDRPSRLFRDLLAEQIRAAGMGRVVVQDDQDPPTGGVRLAGRIEAMGYDADSRSVVVRFDAQRIAADGAITTNRFEAIEPGIAPTAAAVMPALNRAANDVAAQVARWLN